MAISNPRVPTCGECRTWLYNEDWTPCMTERGTVRVPNPTGQTPCHQCPKSEDDQPNPAADMRGRNLAVYQAYLMVRAGIPIDPDPLLAYRLSLIQMVRDRIEAQDRQQVPQLLGTLIGMANRQ